MNNTVKKSTFTLIPAIDLKGGHCVRLQQGRMDAATDYGDDPAAMAMRWQAQGASSLHLVDLDGAFAGKPKNREAIKAICAALTIPVQLGGGLRDLEAIESTLKLGVARVILGSVALAHPTIVRQACLLFPQQICVGIDARHGMVAVHGWDDVSDTSALVLAQSFEDAGVAAIVYTDIARDGMLSGPNIEETLRLAEAVSIPVIASGGIADMAQVQALANHAHAGICGAITGRAIYEGTLDFAAAIQWLDQHAV
ncbi:MAG: 1-(5-phosphoribosyl)-5-[(5-phosphoribosylamino)methylideneamino]imidazole-4-carboxamide isomerase [Mariprofundaceae bacterium]|nr:1-(5-phosphoribosyl)-5-[(5-phosphoribosylamino)methylideneamino]imidazole-4-carboxamide isomerase [Mariprofundaceae bacterium]